MGNGNDTVLLGKSFLFHAVAAAVLSFFTCVFLSCQLSLAFSELRYIRTPVYYH